MEQVIQLGFNEEAHKYFNQKTGEEFISATTLIDRYDQPFNSYYWGMYTALKEAGLKVRPDKKETHITVNGIVTPLQELYDNDLYSSLVKRVKRNWNATTKRSHVRGNKIHNYLEDTINESRGDVLASDNEYIKPLNEVAKNTGLVIFKSKHDLDKTDLAETYFDIYQRLLLYIEQGCTILAEKKIYSTTYGIAGMIDVLIVKGKQFAILDWKSNKDEMMFMSGYYKKVKRDGKWVKGTEFIRKDSRLKYPLDTLQKCKGIKYSLQLSLYAYIMELWGYKLINNGLEIFHIRPNRQPKLIKIKYYKDEIHKLVSHYKESKSKKSNNVKRKFGVI